MYLIGGTTTGRSPLSIFNGLKGGLGARFTAWLSIVPVCRGRALFLQRSVGPVLLSVVADSQLLTRSYEISLVKRPTVADTGSELGERDPDALSEVAILDQIQIELYYWLLYPMLDAHSYLSNWKSATNLFMTRL